jgi:AcrR family transcriptional regulator
MGVREAQKAATRQRVLDAARSLFDSQGYAETTIRAIAKAAGVSVGSVFTSFASKSEILSHVMAERLGELYAELDQVAPHLRGSTADRLRSIFAIHFAFETKRPRLFLAHITAAYDWTLTPQAAPYGRNVHLRQIVLDCLSDGVARGDVDPQADLLLVMETLLAAYGWTYRLVVWEGADAAALSKVMDGHIGLIAQGFMPRNPQPA